MKYVTLDLIQSVNARQEFFCDVAQPTALLRILSHLDQPGHNPLLHRRPERVQLRWRRQLQRKHHKHRLPSLCQNQILIDFYSSFHGELHRFSLNADDLRDRPAGRNERWPHGLLQKFLLG